MTTPSAAASPLTLDGELPTARLAIEASAGTGKTYSLAALATRLIAEDHTPIESLLVVTFSRAAASELRSRIRERLALTARHLDPATELDPAEVDPVLTLLGSDDTGARLRRVRAALQNFDGATITTIHGFAQQVLTTLGASAPGNPDAQILEDTRELVNEVCNDLLVERALLGDFAEDSAPTLRKLVGGTMDLLSHPNAQVRPEPREPAEQDTADPRAPQTLAWMATEAARRVAERRDMAGTMAYDTLLTRLADALEGPNGQTTAATIRARFRVALIDEFQDTDSTQWQIFAKLFVTPDDAAQVTNRLVVVGDPKQAIYAFRGADVHTYLAAVDEPGTERATLTTNWRSDKPLVGALNDLLEGATFGNHEIRYTAVRPAPGAADAAVTVNGAPSAPIRIRLVPQPQKAPGAKKARQLSAGLATRTVTADVARQISELVATGTVPNADGSSRRVRPGDIAVLIRGHADGPGVRSALQRLGVPAVIGRTGSVLRSPAAEQWRWLLVGLSRPARHRQAHLAALSWFVDLDPTSLHDLTEAEAEAMLLQETLHQWATTLRRHGVARLVQTMNDESHFVTRVLAGPDGDRNITDLDHIAELLHQATGGDGVEPSSASATLGRLQAAADAEPEAETYARRIPSDDDAVQIMTAHVSKGLEFPIVAVPFLYRGPGGGSHVFHEEGSWVVSFTGDDKAAADRARVGDDLRLLYVALTRAKHQTLVWWARYSTSNKSVLARVLFARDPHTGAIDSERFAVDQKLGAAHDGPEALAPLLKAAPTIEVSTIEPAAPTVLSHNVNAGETAAFHPASLGRDLDRSFRRLSFSGITSLDHTSNFDAAVNTIEEVGGTDEPTPDPTDSTDAGEPDQAALLELPFNQLGAGGAFGTMVHDVLEHVDFTAEPLEDELVRYIEMVKRQRRSDIETEPLVVALAASIRSPLGPQFGGRALADIPHADRLDEMRFEMWLGDDQAQRSATVRDLGALIVDHLPTDDPLLPWATTIAAGPFPDLALTRTLNGTIDGLFRVWNDGVPGYAVLDYKTNKLSPPGVAPTIDDYHPDELPEAMVHHHYPLQALLYSVGVHRYLRWRQPGYDPDVHLLGATYLFLRGMIGPDTPVVNGVPHGVFCWTIPSGLVPALSDLLAGIEARR